MTKRVLIAGFKHETNTFSKLPTQLTDYESRGLFRGDAIARAFAGTNTEIAAFLDVAKANGADQVIDYGSEDVRARILEITDKRGADVIYDPIGGDIFDGSLRYIAWEGRILTIGYASGRIPSVAANIMLVKNASVVGCYWGAYLKRDPSVIRKSFEELIGWYGDGLLSPHVSNTFQLEEAPDALECLLARKSTGKVVLVTGITTLSADSRRRPQNSEKPAAAPKRPAKTR